MDEEKKDKVTNLFDVIQGGGNPDKNKEILENIRKNMDNVLALLEVNTKLMRAKYSGLITEGFTPEQAMLICLNTRLFMT